MSQITYYVPAGVTSINLSDGSRAVVVGGQITVNSKFRNELESAGCSANADTDNAVRFSKTVTGGIGILLPDGSKAIIAPTIGQTGIPMILPSSGSIGNNGALSGIVALPLAYAGCYMFFPADKIFSGSVAGLYYVVMSSTTAGTIYNNAYTGGVPTIPDSPTPFVTTGPGAYVQQITATELLNFTVPANAMGPNGRLEIRGRISCINNGGSKGVDATFGDTDSLHFINNALTTTAGVEFGNVIANRGNAKVQVANTASFGNLGQASSAALANKTIDTTLAQPIRFKCTMAVAATDYVLIERVSVDCFPG